MITAAGSWVRPAERDAPRFGALTAACVSFFTAEQDRPLHGRMEGGGLPCCRTPCFPQALASSARFQGHEHEQALFAGEGQLCPPGTAYHRCVLDFPIPANRVCILTQKFTEALALS